MRRCVHRPDHARPGACCSARCAASSTQGFAACAIEASSIGIVEHRLAGTRIAVAVFTNFTQDHLDYHGDMDAYWQAKARAVRLAGPARRGGQPRRRARARSWPARCAAAPLDLWTVSTARRPARLRAANIALRPTSGLRFDVHEGETAPPVATPLIGDYNVANLLGVIGALRALGVPLADAARACAAPDAGARAACSASAAPARRAAWSWSTMRTRPMRSRRRCWRCGRWRAQRGGKLWCVFGCGGNRDAEQAPADGRDRARGSPTAWSSPATTRAARRPALILAQILAGIDRPRRRST